MIFPYSSPFFRISDNNNNNVSTRDFARQQNFYDVDKKK